MISRICRPIVLVIVVIFTRSYCVAQIANFVNNGSFEKSLKTFSISGFESADHWRAIDTLQGSHLLFSISPPQLSAPYCSTGFQFPRTGNNFILTSFFCTGCARWNPRNRLKKKLRAK